MAFHFRINATPLLVTRGKKRAAQARRRRDKRRLSEFVKKYLLNSALKLTYANKHKYSMFRRKGKKEKGLC